MKKFFIFFCSFFLISSCSNLLNKNSENNSNVSFQVDLSNIEQKVSRNTENSDGNNLKIYSLLCNQNFINYGQKQMQSVAFKTSVSDEDFIELSKVNGVLGFFDKTIEDIGIPVTIEFNDIAVGTKYFVILAVVINDNLSYFGSSSDDFFMNGILKPLSKYNQIEKGINNIQISMKKVSNGLNFAFCKKDGDSYKFNNGLALLYYKDWPTNMLDINCNKDYLEISRNETESTVSFTKKAASEVMWNSYVVSNLNKKLKACQALFKKC